MPANGEVLPMVGKYNFVRPELLRGFLVKKIIRTKAGFYPSGPNHSTIKLPLLIAPMSSSTIGDTNVMYLFTQIFFS